MIVSCVNAENDKCVICDEIIPEGRQVCPNCERKEDEAMEYTFDNRCSDCKYFKGGKCTHPHSLYCQNCELWTPKWFEGMRKEDKKK